MGDNGAASTAASDSFQQIPSPSTHADLASTAYAPRVRRRNRVIASCLECRRRKLKCNKQAPCSNCTRFRRDCLYLAPALDSASQQKLAAIKDKMGTLEQSLERDVARKSSVDKAGTIKIESGSEDDDGAEYEDEPDLEPTPFAAMDQVYEEDADDDLMDLGFQLGKLRVSDRIGGFFRPKFAEELQLYPDTREGLPSVQHHTTAAQSWLLSDAPSAFLGPGPDYLAPASSFYFPRTSGQSTLHDYLPSMSTCDKLLAQYWLAVHPLVTIVHKPTFIHVYRLFWKSVMAGSEPPASTQSIVSAMLFSAAVSLRHTAAMEQFGTHRDALVERLQAMTEASLSRANFLRTTKLEVMQAFVLYLVPLCRAEVSRAHSAMVGTAIRLAECMGLHREPSLYGFSAVETHVRRLIWYQLCFLDMRTIEATGPRAQIRKEDFDTKLPLNVNEEDLLSDPPPTQDKDEFTDMTLSRLRFETTEMHRQVWIDHQRIDAKKLKHSAALAKIQRWKADMETRYFPLLNGNDARQSLALHIYRILSYRLFIMLLHRFLAGTKEPMPERLRRILMDAILATNEFTISLDTRPELAVWAWYRGALLQYQSALLLLFHVHQNQNSVDAPRIWKVLDYVFELPVHMTAVEKTQSIIFALKDRLQVYQSMRKMRALTTTDEAVKKMGLLDNPLAYEGKSAGRPVTLSVIEKDESSSGGQPLMGKMTESEIAAAAAASHFDLESFQTTAQMDVTQFSVPPLAPQLSSSDGGSQASQFGYNAYMGTVPSGSGSEDVDWSDFDKLFPSDQAGLGGTTFPGTSDLSSFDLGGSFTPFIRQNVHPQSKPFSH